MKVFQSFLLVAFIFQAVSCSRSRDEISANDVDPNFVPSTSNFNLLSSDLSNLSCFYENNYVEVNADTSILNSIAWYLVQDNNSILMSEDKKQIFETAGNYRAKLNLNIDGNPVDSTINFQLKYCDVFLVVPDAFKPNADGIYDVWAPIGEGVEKITYTVSTRRGKKIFESTSLENAWDGTYSGDKMASGTYRYYLTGTYKNGYLFEKKGTFELIR